MAKAPALITSPKIKKLAAKAASSPSRLTTEETRELGTSVMAHLAPLQPASAIAKKKGPAVKTPAKIALKKSVSKTAQAKKVVPVKASAKKVAAKKNAATEAPTTPVATEPVPEQG